MYDYAETAFTKVIEEMPKHLVSPLVGYGMTPKIYREKPI